LAAVFQAIGLFRYVTRLPGDWIGIGLYVVTIVAFAAISIGSFLQDRSRQR
jgi:hypothetical protein